MKWIWAQTDWPKFRFDVGRFNTFERTFTEMKG